MQLYDNWLEHSAISDSLRLNNRYVEQMASLPVGELLVGYVKQYEHLMNKSQIEWRLAERVLSDGLPKQVGDGLQLPPEILERYSGLILQWVLNQCLQKRGDLLGRLKMQRLLTSRQAMILAGGWALWPTNPALQRDHRQMALFEWLKPHRNALGRVTLALAAAGNLSLAKESAQLWLYGPLDDVKIAYLLSEILSYPELRDESRQALRRVIRRYRNEPKMLEALCAVAFKADCNEETLEASELALTPAPPQSPPILGGRQGGEVPPLVLGGVRGGLDAYRIAAFARLGERDAAVNGYRQRWYQTEAIFPYPDLLLPVMTRPDVKPLRQHLLNHCELSEEVPAWVRLEYLHEQKRWQESIEGWSRLLAETIEKYLPTTASHQAIHPTSAQASRLQKDQILRQWVHLVETQVEIRYFLDRLTNSLVQIRPSIPQPYHQETVTLWKTLVGENRHLDKLGNRYRQTSNGRLFSLAQSALLLLEPSFGNQVSRYDRHLRDAPLSYHSLLTRAARSYVEALISLQRWPQLIQFYEQKEVAALRQVCTHDEYYFFQGMVEVKKQADVGDVGDEWCYRWEELISLFLTDEQVQAVLEHFVEIWKELRRHNASIVKNPRLRDVKLQLTRRGKAIGERMLRDGALPNVDQERLRKRLLMASLEGLSKVLKEIKKQTNRR